MSVLLSSSYKKRNNFYFPSSSFSPLDLGTANVKLPPVLATNKASGIN